MTRILTFLMIVAFLSGCGGTVMFHYDDKGRVYKVSSSGVVSAEYTEGSSKVKIDSRPGNLFRISLV